MKLCFELFCLRQCFLSTHHFWKHAWPFDELTFFWNSDESFVVCWMCLPQREACQGKDEVSSPPDGAMVRSDDHDE